MKTPLTPEELKEKYVGVQVVMVTPFHEDFSLDEDGLRRNTRFLVESGVHILHPTGSTGEFWNLTPEEHKRAMEIVIDEAKGKIPVVPGTGYSGTKQTIEMSRYAEEIGADGVMVVPPYYVVPTPEGIYEHYKTLAQSLKIGIVVYNNPSMTKINLGSDLLAKLAEIPNIVAVKDTSRDIIDIFSHQYLLGDKLTFSVGLGELEAPYFYLSGGRGHVSDIANFAPHIALGMYNAAMEKDWEKISKLHFKLNPYFDFIEKLSKSKNGMIWITILKEAMRILGMPGWPPRKPLLPLTKKEREELKEILKKIGIL